MPVPGADRRSVLRIHHDKLPADNDHASTAASPMLGRMRLLVDSGRERLEAHAEWMQSIGAHLPLRKAVIQWLGLRIGDRSVFRSSSVDHDDDGRAVRLLLRHHHDIDYDLDHSGTMRRKLHVEILHARGEVV